MASQKKGLMIGKVGDTVTYLLDGNLVTRRIGITNKKPTKPQLTFRQSTRVFCRFMKPITDFINVGFELMGKRTHKRPYALAFGYNMKCALKGVYPKVVVDYEKVRLTEGNMPVVSNVKVEVVETGLKFTWDPDATLSGVHWTDQVMLLAYFPKLKKAMYITAGANRDIGSCLLPLYETVHGNLAETYISFISNDRRSISNSTYTGQWLW